MGRKRIGPSAPASVTEEAHGEERSEAWEQCAQLARNQDILEEFPADLSRLGVVGELLKEIGELRACCTFVDTRLKAYAELDPEIIKALGADKFPRPPLYEVKP